MPYVFVREATTAISTKVAPSLKTSTEASEKQVTPRKFGDFSGQERSSNQNEYSFRFPYVATPGNKRSLLPLIPVQNCVSSRYLGKRFQGNLDHEIEAAYPCVKNADPAMIPDANYGSKEAHTNVVSSRGNLIQLSKLKIKPGALRRARSLPATPSIAKSVRFAEDLEEIRYFEANGNVLSVSADSSPVEELTLGIKPIHWDIFLCNPPRLHAERKAMPLYLEEVFIGPNGSTLMGTIRVANLAFEKHVVARFTLDNWQTLSDVKASYVRKSENEYDLFIFKIELNEYVELERKKMQLCLRYQVMDREYWDNNFGQNFMIRFIKNSEELKPGWAHRDFSSRYGSTSSDNLSNETSKIKLKLDTIINQKQGLNSLDYKTFVDNFCFAGSSQPKET